QQADRSDRRGDRDHDGLKPESNSEPLNEKTARFSPGGFLFGSDCLLAAAEAPRPPARLAWRAVVRCGWRSRLGRSRFGRLDRFGRKVSLHQRWRGLGRAAVEIGNRGGHFGSWRRPELVCDRSGKALFQLGTTPAASAATSATARAPLATGGLIAAGHAGLLVAFVLVGFAVLGGRAFDGLAHNAHHVTVLARGGAVTRLATAAP